MQLSKFGSNSIKEDKMNRKRFFIPVIFSVVLFLIWTVSLASAGVLEDIKSKGVLVVSTDANYAPQSFLNDKGELDGFDSG
jgi:polar amino acid transport system substrate-binding protein